MEARQSHRCRALKPAEGRDPGERSRWGDLSPEAAGSAGTKPSPTAANGREPKRSGSAGGPGAVARAVTIPATLSVSPP